MEIIIPAPNSPILFEICNINIRWYGFFISIAMLFGVFFSFFLIKKNISKIVADKFIDFAPLLILISIIGARLFYVIGDFDYYFKFPSEIIMINHGGLSLYGAILFGVLSIILFCNLNKIACLKLFDIFALIMPICQSIGRLGNYFNQEAFGKPSEFILKLYIDKPFRPMQFADFNYFHPVFLYEIVANLIIFICLYLVSLKKYKSGTIFYLYLILYSFIRYFLELIRVDSVLNIGNFTVAQIISIIIFIISFSLLIKIYKKLN